MANNNEGGAIPQCLKGCKSDKECDPRDRCDLTSGGGACLPKECPMHANFGMLKKRETVNVQATPLVVYTMTCHGEYIMRHRIKNNAYRFHPVECRFNVTGSNHVKWVLKETETISSSYDDKTSDVEAMCENGMCMMDNRN